MKYYAMVLKNQLIMDHIEQIGARNIYYNE